MANFSELKQAIAAVVKANNNQEITGTGMQNVLNTIVNSIANGFLFKGLATPSTSPGNPDSTMFWIGGAGMYTNFGTPSFEVPVGKIAIFKYDGTFSRTTINLFSVASSIQDNNDSLVTSRQAKGELDKKANTVDIANYRSEGAELPLGAHYTYYGNPTHALAGYCQETDNDFVGVCIYHWGDSHTIVLYVKDENDKYIYSNSFRTEEASTTLEKHVADLFGGVPVTYERDGLMKSEDKQMFDDMVTEVFPLTVDIASSNAGTREIGTSVTPNIVLSITRKGVDVSANAVTTSNIGTVQPNHKTITDSAKTSGTTTYRISVSQGGQTRAVADQVFKFLNYAYGGELNSKPSGSSAVKTQIESWGSSHGVLSDKKNSTAITSSGEIGLAASKYYLFAVKQTASGVPITLIVKNANSGGTIDVPSSDKGSDLQITRVNGSGSDYYSWVIVPASPNSWTFKITNS